MISWLQTNLQKHFRFVFIILLVVIIVAFVFTIGNQGPLSGRDERTASLFFFDTPLNSQEARTRFERDTQLSVTLNRNFRASQTLPYERATALHIANKHLIPEPNKEQLRAYIETLPAFQGQNGEFDAQAYNMLLDSMRLGGGISENDLHRVLVDDYRIAKVYTALRGADFVNESEILEGLGQRLAKWSILLAEYDLGTYTPELEITEEMLKSHFEEFSFTYQTPERRVVNFVEVEARDFVEEIKPSEDELITYFEANYDRYQPTQVEGEEAPTTDPVTFEQARLAVRSDLRLESAQEVALERAHDLVVSIIENDFTRESEGLKNTLADKGLELQSSSPFAANETPIGTQWGRDVLTQAFALSEDRFYSEPVQVGTKSIVLFYNQVIESKIPEFETLRERIAVDVRTEQYRKARSEYAVELKDQLTEAGESEDTFGAAAEEAGLTVGSYLDFSVSEPAEGLDRRALTALIGLKPGEVSDFVRLDGDNQGAYVYVISKEVPEVSKDDPEYAQVEQSLKSLYGQFSASQYIQKLMVQEQMRIGLISQTN